MNKASVNPARSLYYGLMSKMFVFSADDDRYEGVLEALDVLIANPLDENSGEALKEIKEFIEAYGCKKLAEEYDEIFHNPESPVVRDTASYYDDGTESGKKRVEVQNFLAKTRIRRDEKNYFSHEDSVGFLVTFMHELIELAVEGEKSYVTVEHCLFDEVINDFIDAFIGNLYEHKSANAYRSLAIALNAFMEFERFYFGITKPAPKPKVLKENGSYEFVSEKEEKRRKENRIKRNADALLDSCSMEGDESDDAGLENIR
jgi:TorA maturation chaperone TorD